MGKQFTVAPGYVAVIYSAFNPKYYNAGDTVVLTDADYTALPTSLLNTVKTGTLTTVADPNYPTYPFGLVPFESHILASTGSAPAAAAGANAGTSPPAPVIGSNAGDARFSLTFGTGTTPAAGAQVAVTFASAYAATPVVGPIPLNAATQALGLYISAVSTSGFTLSTVSAPAASQANTIYSVAFEVIG